MEHKIKELSQKYKNGILRRILDEDDNGKLKNVFNVIEQTMYRIIDLSMMLTPNQKYDNKWLKTMYSNIEYLLDHDKVYAYKEMNTNGGLYKYLIKICKELVEELVVQELTIKTLKKNNIPEDLYSHVNSFLHL